MLQSVIVCSSAPADPEKQALQRQYHAVNENQLTTHLNEVECEQLYVPINRVVQGNEIVNMLACAACSNLPVVMDSLRKCVRCGIHLCQACYKQMMSGKLQARKDAAVQSSDSQAGSQMLIPKCCPCCQKSKGFSLVSDETLEHAQKTIRIAVVQKQSPSARPLDADKAT